jgi:hypothetical protein
MMAGVGQGRSRDLMTTPAASAPEDLLAKRRESQNYFSGRVSDLSRNIGYGLAAIAFALLSSEAPFAKELAGSAKWLIILIAVAGSVTALLDYLQMFAGWLTATLSANNVSGNYQKTLAAKSWDVVQMVAFYGKQVSAIVGALVLIFAVAGSVF